MHDYERLFLRFSAKMEKLLILMIVVLAGLLLLTQALFKIPGFRNYFVPAARLEGVYVGTPSGSKDVNGN